MQRSKYEGGIALPNVRKSYEAAQTVVINGWAYADLQEPAYRLDRWGMGEKSYLHSLYVGHLLKEAAPATQEVVLYGTNYTKR